MPGKQKDIKQFFSPKTKSLKDSVEEKNDEQFTPKKRKVELEEEQENTTDSLNSGSTSTLSPDQKARMSTNKVLAQIKVTSKKLPGALHSNIGPSWFEALAPEFNKPYFQKLNDFLIKERQTSTKIFPPENEVWSWTHHFPVKDTKVVILGQDPYHGPGQAHGLCFSVKRPVNPPPSLINMYKLLEKDIDGFQRPKHGCLVGWSKQGVLLLNACLTVRQAQANSHKDQGWETLTSSVVKFISDECTGVVFLLWGSYAQKKASIVNNKKHFLLKSVHPSPLSAHRGFLDSKHFSKCNELLVQQGKTPIDWGKLDD